MSILKGKNGYWFMSAYIDGQNVTIRRSIKGDRFLTKGEAKNEYDAAIENWKFQHGKLDKQITFDQLILEYDLERERSGIRLSTRKTSDICAYAHMAALKGKSLKSALSIPNVQKWYNALRDSNSPGTVNRTSFIFRDMISLAKKNHYITSDDKDELIQIVCNVKNPKNKGKERVAWTYDEAKRFLDVIDPLSRDYAMFVSLSFLGCRFGEFLALTPDDIDFQNGQVIFQHEIMEATGNGWKDISKLKTDGSWRTKPIPNLVLDLLKRQIVNDHLKSSEELKGKKNYLWHPYNNKEKPMSRHGFRTLMGKYVAIAKVPYTTPYGLRHTASTWLGQQCHSIADVVACAKMQGNTPEVFLNTYANHVQGDTQVKIVSSVASKFEEVINKKEIA